MLERLAIAREDASTHLLVPIARYHIFFLLCSDRAFMAMLESRPERDSAQHIGALQELLHEEKKSSSHAARLQYSPFTVFVLFAIHSSSVHSRCDIT